jgi:RloB-like protein
LFLIVCEDQKTEPYYFEKFVHAFPEHTVFLRTVGTGKSSKGVVEQAIIEREKLLTDANKNVDEVWAVFDKDDADKSAGNTARFMEAFSLAKEHRMEVAYSNEAFELWILLHFATVEATTPIPRAEIYERIEAAICQITGLADFTYEHGNTNVIDILLRNGNEQKAIAHATKLLETHLKKGNQPLLANPSTAVHLLVHKLRDLIAYYSYVPE